jgi:hypothetical protein
MKPTSTKGNRPLTEAMRRINAAINRQPSAAPAASHGARVFVSYSTADTERVAMLVADLEDMGFSPWWSPMLTGGEAFRPAIVEQLDAADAAVVLWSPDSVRSGWVETEAKRAHEQRKLVPLRLARLRVSDIPPPFGTLQTLAVDDLEGIRQALARVVAARKAA